MTITCEFVAYMPDMYPEFAPEPLAIPCKEEAVAWVRWHDHCQDCTGERLDVFCREHVELVVHEVLHWGGSAEMCTLSERHEQEYRKGQRYGQCVAVSREQFLAAQYVSWGEAGVSTPENSPVMFDAGFDQAMNDRMVEWQSREEVTDE